MQFQGMIDEPSRRQYPEGSSVGIKVRRFAIAGDLEEMEVISRIDSVIAAHVVEAVESDSDSEAGNSHPTLDRGARPRAAPGF